MNKHYCSLCLKERERERERELQRFYFCALSDLFVYRGENIGTVKNKVKGDNVQQCAYAQTDIGSRYIKKKFGFVNKKLPRVGNQPNR